MQTNDPINWSKAIPRKISIRINKHSTSVSLEQPFLEILKAIARKEGRSLTFIITNIDKQKPQHVNLSAALRIYVLHNVLTQDICTKYSIEEVSPKT
ncbi:ribbon-helix-helix domain-containing protein [Bartonella sp. B10]